jgi:hypothetical protein
MDKANRLGTKTFSTVFEDDTLYWGEAQDLAVRIEDGVLKWTEVISELDVPDEIYVLDGIVYAGGTKIGVLGKVNTDQLDISKQIKENIILEIKNIYPILEDLAYVEDISKNNFRGNKNRLGVRELDLAPTNEVVGRETIDREFEIILTTDYINKGKNDTNQRASKDTLIERAEYIRRKMRKTKAGSYQNVRITRSFIENEVEFLENEGVTIIRMQITVNYRVNP